MGYRSDLALVVYPDYDNPSEARTHEARAADCVVKYQTLKLLMNTQFKDVNEGWSPTFDDPRQQMLIQATDIKYYDSFPEIQALERLKDEIVELGYCMEFIRIGEESDDIDETYEGNRVEYVLRVARSIEIN
jgi:hypothetical protein